MSREGNGDGKALEHSSDGEWLKEVQIPEH